MIEYVLMSTCSLSAVDVAPIEGLTLNPIIMALDADASITSDSVMAPTPEWITFTRTSSLLIFSSELLRASIDP